MDIKNITAADDWGDRKLRFRVKLNLNGTEFTVKFDPDPNPDKAGGHLLMIEADGHDLVIREYPQGTSNLDLLAEFANPETLFNQLDWAKKAHERVQAGGLYREDHMPSVEPAQSEPFNGDIFKYIGFHE